MAFEYYYGTQADQYNFIKVPKLLVHDKAFAELSVDAKMLYGLLLDRMNLSMKNGWLDEQNRVYIMYPIAEIMEDLNMSKPTAIKYMNELVKFGLVEKKRQGLSKSNIIYVKSFMLDNNRPNRNGEKDYDRKKFSKENVVEKPMNTQKSNILTSRSKEILPQEVKDFNFKKSNVFTSEGKEVLPQEVKEIDPNKNNINNNYINNTKNINTEYNNIFSYPTMKANCENISQIGNGLIKNNDVIREKTGVSEFNAYMNFIKHSIDYDELIARHNEDKSMIDGIVNLIVETIISENDYIVISSNKFPKEVVKGRLSKLDISHIEYVLECMRHNTTDVKNIKKYLLAALYNAPTTIDSYYQSRVNHDFPQYAK